jgi:hypothetical protein
MAQNDLAFTPEFINAAGPLSLNVTTLVVDALATDAAPAAAIAATENKPANDNLVYCIKTSLFPESLTYFRRTPAMGFQKSGEFC